MLSYLRLGLPVVLLAALAGCGPDYSPNTYSAVAVQQANKVDQGVIAGYREIAIRADGTVGTVTGGAAGGVLGAQAPDGGVVTALSTIGGTLIGGLVGNSVEHAAGDTKAFEYIVRKTNGDLVSVTQKDQTPLAIGLKVLVIEGKQARIVADYSVPLEPAAPSAIGATAQTKTNSGATAETKSAKTETPTTDTAGGSDKTDKALSDHAPTSPPAAQSAPPAAPPSAIVESSAPPINGTAPDASRSPPATALEPAPQTAETTAPDTTTQPQQMAPPPAAEPPPAQADQAGGSPPVPAGDVPAPRDDKPTP